MHAVRREAADTEASVASQQEELAQIRDNIARLRAEEKKLRLAVRVREGKGRQRRGMGGGYGGKDGT